MVFRRVVFPAPFAPISERILPLPTLTGTSCRTSIRPYRLLTFLTSSTGCLTDTVISQISADHAFVALNLLRCALADRPPPVQNVDSIGYSHDQFHVMLHQQHGYAGIGDSPYQGFDLRRFCRIAAGGWLVKEGEFGRA